MGNRAGRARLEPMGEAALEAWRSEREAAGAPLPSDGDDWTAVRVVLDEVVVGGAVLTLGRDGSSVRCSVRVLQTTLPHQAGPEWDAVLAALEGHARARSASTLVTAVPASLTAPFRRAGYAATMTTHAKRLDPASAPELQEDRRVAVRPMTATERTVFTDEVRSFLRAGMDRAGVTAAETPLAALEDRLAELADPPPTELLMTGTVDGEPVGRAWATLITRDDGSLDFLGNTIDLFAEHRGQGLTTSFLGALRRHVHELGVRDVVLNVYGHDAAARDTFLGQGAGIAEVHVRKDL